MASYALQRARAKRGEAKAAIEAHDQACEVCDVRRRVRCDLGMALVHAYRAADHAVAEENAAARRGPAGLVPLFGSEEHVDD